jgi:ubiquinone/menaquinone biosynthesis C-methylase UbiE
VGDLGAPEAYALGFSEHEQRRLALQDRLFARFTRALLVDAGVGPGMSVLDVGAGVGDVSMLAAQLVGDAGSVTGVERSGAYVRAARQRAADRGLTQVEFVEADLFDYAPRRPYDAILGRFVLEWLPDPAAALRRLADHLRPGGALVFQDYDHPLREGQHSYPVAPLFERVLASCVDALAAPKTHVAPRRAAPPLSGSSRVAPRAGGGGSSPPPRPPSLAIVDPNRSAKTAVRPQYSGDLPKRCGPTSAARPHGTFATAR